MKDLFGKILAFVKRHKVGCALAFILLMASFFRLWHLGSLPPGLHPDEAANGLDVFRIQQGDWRVLYATNGPREALFFYLQAIFVTLLGNTIFALRVAPALIGIAAVGMTYLWIKEWFSKRAALAAAAFMATGTWAVTISRDGFRAGMMPLMLALVGWTFTLAYKKRKLQYYLLAGFSIGLGFYTYLSYRFIIAIALAIALYALIFFRKQFIKFIVPLIIMAVVAGITVLPLGLYAVKHPDDVLGGRSSVAITNPELNNGSVTKTFAQNVVKTAGMFNIEGDHNYRHNLGGLPMLNAFVGILFILGILISVRRFRDIRYFSLLVVFSVMLLPALLTAEGIPHGLRAIGVLPSVYIFAAIGFTELLSRWRGVFPRNPAAISLALIILLGLTGMAAIYDYQRYFNAWANNPNTYKAYSEDAVAVGNFIRNSSFKGERYAVIDGYSNIDVLYLTHNKASYTRLDTSELKTLPGKGPRQFVVVENQNRNAEPLLTQQKATLVKRYASPNRPDVTMYYVYEIN